MRYDVHRRRVTYQQDTLTFMTPLTTIHKHLQPFSQCYNSETDGGVSGRKLTKVQAIDQQVNDIASETDETISQAIFVWELV